MAQLIDLGDPELENFAAFSTLLAKRLDGVAPEAVDLTGLALKGFDIKAREPAAPTGFDEPEDDDLTLTPMGAGGSPMPGGMPLYLREVIERLNSLFGEAAPIRGHAAFVNQIAAIAREDKVVMAQVEKADMDLTLKGNLPGAVQKAVVRAMTSNNALATLLLKSDRHVGPRVNTSRSVANSV